MCFIQQGIKFTVALTQMTWLLGSHTGINNLTHKYILVHVLTAAICITLNLSLTDIKNLSYRGH